MPPRSAVELSAGRIAYHEQASGAGLQLVFLHGFGCNGALWAHVLPELARDWRCLAPTGRSAPMPHPCVPTLT